MIAMAKKPTKRPVGRPTIDEESDSASFRCTPSFKEALVARAKRHRRTLSQEIALMLEERMAADGEWPVDAD